MVARLFDASNVSLACPSPAASNAAPWTANNAAFGESNGLGYKGGNSNNDSIGPATTGLESGVRAINVVTRNTSTYSTGRGVGAYFIPPRCTAASQDVRDNWDGRTHTTVGKVHCTWRIATTAFSKATGVAHYNHVVLGVYDTAGSLIAGIRVQHRGDMLVFHLEPWLATSNPGDTFLGQIRNSLGSQDVVEHATTDTDKYATFELVVDTTLSSPSSDSTRAAARIVLPTGQAQPWVVQTWDSSDMSLSENAADSWQIWAMDKDGTSGAPGYEPIFKLDNYHHVDGTDWWSNFDTYGIGHDGFGHGVKIAELKATSELQKDASGWTASTGTTYGCVDDLPFALGDYISCGTADKQIVFGTESFLTKVGWSAAPYGEILGVVPKAYACWYSATDYYLGSNYRLGLANSSYATWTQGNGVASYSEMTAGTTRNFGNACGWGVNEKPSGGAWDASTIDTDLRLWIKQGPIYGAKYPTVYDVVAYVVYREPQRAVGSSSGGQGVLTAAPTLTRARVASSAGRNCSRIDITDTQAPNGVNAYRAWELPSLDSNGVTMNWVFGDYSPVTGKYYVCSWDKNLWDNVDPQGAGTGRFPCVAEVDPATGTAKIIWSAGETTSGASADVGGPHFGSSGNWWWQPQGTGGGVPRAQRIHFLKVDKRPKFLDGTTNPFYGHVFCSLFDNGNTVTAPVLQNMGMLWLDPTQARTGDYCVGRFLPWERTSGDSYGRGAWGLCTTEDYVYLAAPYERNAVANSIIHRFNKKNFTATGRWSSGTVGTGHLVQNQADDWDAPIDTGATTTLSTLQPLVNQVYYLGGKVWVTAACPFGFEPGNEAATIVGPWKFDAGTKVPDDFNTRQLTIHPTTGNLWGYGQWVAGTATNSRIKDWLDTYEFSGSRTGWCGNDAIGLYESDSTDGTVLRYWRIPLEITDDGINATASKQGTWNRNDADSYCPHGAFWVDENTLLISVGEHRSPGDYSTATEWPRSTLMVFRRDDETWHQVTKPAKNMNGLVLVDALATDRGRFSSGSANAPANRHDLMGLAGASPVQNPSTWDSTKLRHRYVWVDTGFTKSGNGTDNYKYAATGVDVGDGSKGHVIEVFLRPPLLRENEIEISAEIDLSGTSITSIDEWRMELRSGGTVGQGSCFASGGSAAVDANGKVRVRGYIQGSEWKPGGSASDIDVFWRVTSSGRQYWNSRSTS